MKRLLLVLLLACTVPSNPVAKGPERDYDTLVCKPIKPHWMYATPIRRGFMAHSECRIASYWKVVNNQWVAK